MTDPFTLVSDDVRRCCANACNPWAGPMLAVVTEDRFSDPNWIFERKPVLLLDARTDPRLATEHTTDV